MSSDIRGEYRVQHSREGVWKDVRNVAFATKDAAITEYNQWNSILRDTPLRVVYHVVRTDVTVIETKTVDVN